MVHFSIRTLIKACWSQDGKHVYCGRRNNTVDDFDLVAGRFATKFKLPIDSGPVSLVKSMPDGKHLLM